MVGEMSWRPFAYRDPTTPTGWAGMDLDLLARVAELAGFTYEIFDMDAAAYEGESWEEQLFRFSNHTDLVMSYWAETALRRSKVTQLLGHFDYGTVLVVRPGEEEEVPFEKRMFTFFEPFTWELWGVLIGIIVLSGLFDNLLERRSGGSLTESMYEYFAGTMWGGFERPRTRLSGIYQIVLSFVLLVTISAYTANLAAFLTIAGTPTLSAEDVSELIVASKPVCCRDGDPRQEAYQSYFPELTYRKMAVEDLPYRLADGTCDALFVPNINFQMIRHNDAANCQFEIAQNPIAGKAGWGKHMHGACMHVCMHAAPHPREGGLGLVVHCEPLGDR